jgi:hypothetical protein
MTYEQSRSRSRSGNGDTYLESSIRRGSSHLFRNGSRVAEQPRQAGQVEHDFPAGRVLSEVEGRDARRELTRHVDQRPPPPRLWRASVMALGRI